MMQYREERGASLIGVVVSVVLLIILGTSAVYGYGALKAGNSKGNAYDSTKTTVDSSLVSSTLRMDMSGAQALRSSSSNLVQIARADGSCVNWFIAEGPAGSQTLLRSASFGGPASSAGGSEVAKGLQSGVLSVQQNTFSVELVYGKGSSISESASAGQISSDGGECW